MSLSKQPNGGHPIGFDTGDRTIVFLNPKATNGVNEMTPVGQFEPFHSGDQIIYIAAPRGAGKSTFCNIYIRHFADATDGRVFLVSRFEEDPSITLPPRSMRLSIPDLAEVEMSDLKNSLLVCDDVHSSSFSKAQSSFLSSFIKDVIENSRHYNLSCLITSHLITDYAKTRAILNEMSAIVVYPLYGAEWQMRQALENYVGMSKPQIEKVLQSPDRWVMVRCRYPKYVLSNSAIYIWK